MGNFVPSDKYIKSGRARLVTQDDINIGLTALFLFNEGVGGTITDVTRNNYTAALTGGASWQNGKFGKTIKYNGTNGSHLYDPNIKGGQTFTYSFWVKRMQDGLRYPLYLGSNETAGVTGYGGISFYESLNSNVLRMEIAQGPTIARQSIIASSGAYGDMTGNFLWNHIVGVSDGSTLYLYLNGRLVGTATKTVTISWNTGFYSAIQNTQNPGGIGGDWFNGYIDNVRAYTNRALTASQVRRLYEDPYAGIETTMGVQALTLEGADAPSGNTTVDQTITGVSRIQATTTRTETGLARIQVITTQTKTGLARIQKTVAQTESGVARIQVTTTKTESGVSRIQITTTQTITGVANIVSATGTTTQTISGVARIQATTTRTESGVARIQKTVTQTITGVSRIGLLTTKTETGLARITATATRTEAGVARITATTTRTISGVARISTGGATTTPLRQYSIEVGTGISQSVTPTGNMIEVEIVTSAPSDPPTNDKGVVFSVSGGVVTIYVWDGSAWRAK